MSYKRSYEHLEGETAKDPLFYEMGSSVLKNKLGITDPQKAAEEETIGFIRAQVIFTEKLSKNTRFNEKYIQGIHKTSLSHIYPFAGIYRNVNLSKAGHHFLPCAFIARGMNYLEFVCSFLRASFLMWASVFLSNRIPSILAEAMALLKIESNDGLLTGLIFILQR